MATNVPVTLDTPITIRIYIQGSNRKFKLPLRDLTPQVLPDKLSRILGIPSDQDVIFERFSDSVGTYVRLDPENPQVYRTLFRAAKAKLKLRLRATTALDWIEPAHADEVDGLAKPAPRIANQLSPPNRNSAHPIATSAVAAPNHEDGSDKTQSQVDNGLTAQRILALKKLLERNLGPSSEPPVPEPLSARPEACLSETANTSRHRELAFRTKEASLTLPSGAWSVYCNSCDKAMENEHYHCSICDDGDYDLCGNCVDAGVHCPGEGHWLIKRVVKHGSVITSTTERVGPKTVKYEKESTHAFTEERNRTETELQSVQIDLPTRTCNSCVKVFLEREFVTCNTCDDYDLCIRCHEGAKHGHHPAHAFSPATHDAALGTLAQSLCAPGRNVWQTALCDGCDDFIRGVRHKCLTCPDFDYCNTCIKKSGTSHPVHRFVPIYEPIPEARFSRIQHHGIFCDGPLCQAKPDPTYIVGTRYKCAVCPDTDFCANCEANPGNGHNRTHPLIMFKTPVRHVNVTTVGEDKNGLAMPPMGDQPQRRSTSTETNTVSSPANAATKVKTIVDLKPSDEAASRNAKEKIEIRNLLLAEPTHEKIKVQDLLSTSVPEMNKEKSCVEAQAQSFAPTGLNAHFVHDVISDGSDIPTNMVFTQCWALRNPGPQDWPAGCSVRYVGGDNMLNVDDSHPSSADEIAKATESNLTTDAVKPGELVHFAIRMKAPRREGTAISYWRLKSADGTPFGHRLWCHINAVSDLRNCNNPPLPLQPQIADLKMQQTQLADRSFKTKSANPAAEITKGSCESRQVPAELSSSKQIGNAMIFPQLEKESPVSSTHDVTDGRNTSTEPASAVAPEVEDELENFDDDEIVEIMDASSDDDGFLTDEEYEILDASDEEERS